MNNVLSRHSSIRCILSLRKERLVAASVVNSLPNPEDFNDEQQSFFPEYEIKDLKDEELDEISQSFFSENLQSENLVSENEAEDQLLDKIISEEIFQDYSNHENQNFGGEEIQEEGDEEEFEIEGETETTSPPIDLLVVSVVSNNINKSLIERLPKDLQNIIFNQLPLEDVNNILRTCKIFSEHSTEQLVRAIKQYNSFFRKRLLRFTYLLKLFARPEILVNELNILQGVSAKLATMFQKLHEKPESYNRYKNIVEKELRALLEYRLLLGIFVDTLIESLAFE